MKHSRRSFLKFGAAGAGALMFPELNLLKAAPAGSEPHYFLMIIMNGGADPSYFYDGRPLAMTAAKKIQNYTKVEPTKWTGVNGGTCWAGSLSKPLDAFRDRFSVLNGVWMTPSFDGHLQNMNYLITGNAFGGESFVPHVNHTFNTFTGRPHYSLDAIQSDAGELLWNANNHAGVVPLNPEAVGPFVKALGKTSPISASDELGAFIHSRIERAATGKGRFGSGSHLMKVGLEEVPDIHQRLTNLKAAAASDSDVKKAAVLMADCFKHSVARSAIYIMPEYFDTHAPEGAKQQLTMFKSATDQITTILNTLKNSPYDGIRSMLDMTTFVITSEMGRTMRQNGMPIDGTGTDHNQFGNSVIIGGRGIKPGMVVGASDYQDAKETVSKAHLSVDPRIERVIGRPFDFAAMMPRTDLPATIKPEEYLTINSVVNTIYDLFDVPKNHYRILGRNLPEAPVLKGLLA